MHAAGEAGNVIPATSSAVSGTPAAGVPAPFAPDLAQLGHRVLMERAAGPPGERREGGSDPLRELPSVVRDDVIHGVYIESGSRKV
jgi:hypothetical protein